MKKFKKIIASLLVFVLIFGLWGCSKDGIGKVSENLSTYTISATLNDADKTLQAQQTVVYKNNYDIELYDICFNLYPNAFRQESRFYPVEHESYENTLINDKLSFGKIEIKKVKLNGKDIAIKMAGQDDNAIRIPLEEPLMPTGSATIEFEYKVTIPNLKFRFGYCDNNINLGNFYPVAGIYEDGEWRVDPYYSNGDPFYSEVANYNVTLVAPKKYTVAMSGNVLVSENTDNKTKTFECSTIAMRDFAIVLGEFTVITLESKNGTAVKYYYYNDPTPDESLKVAVDSINTFGDLFGEYPYGVYSVVQTPFGYGGMEYPGIVYISDRQTGTTYKDVIVHETAHQWWYGLVGNDQIRNAWLDESLAEFSTNVFYEKNPSYNIKYSDRLGDAISSYSFFVEMFKPYSKSMNRRLPEFLTSTDYIYMIYAKGQIMFDSLRLMIGDDAMFLGLKNYFNNNAYKIAKPDNLIGEFEKTSGMNLSSFFESWLEGKASVVH